jgi:hypothetical protein
MARSATQALQQKAEYMTATGSKQSEAATLRTGLGPYMTVRIHLAPPTSLYILPTFWRTGQDPSEMRHSFNSQRNRESRLTPDWPNDSPIPSLPKRHTVHALAHGVAFVFEAVMSN